MQGFCAACTLGVGVRTWGLEIRFRAWRLATTIEWRPPKIFAQLHVVRRAQALHLAGSDETKGFSVLRRCQATKS